MVVYCRPLFGLSVHSIETRFNTTPPDGERFAGNEARIDIAEAYFNELATHSGLAGRYVVGNLYGQQVILFEAVITKPTTGFQ